MGRVRSVLDFILHPRGWKEYIQFQTSYAYNILGDYENKTFLRSMYLIV